MKAHIGVALIIAMSWLCLAPVATAEEPKEMPYKATAVFTGTHSEIKKERFAVVYAAEVWKRLWEEHRGKENRFTESYQELEIDFETHFVVAVFAGSCDWCGINTRITSDELRVGFRAGVNQTEGGGEFGARPRTTVERAKDEAQAPYAFVVLPRPVRKIVIEQDVRRLIDESPVWEVRTAFPVISER
jgi:hypothetical protein